MRNSKLMWGVWIWILLIFCTSGSLASESGALPKILIEGSLKDNKGAAIKCGKIIITQGENNFEIAVDNQGYFQEYLSPIPTSITYQASGYMSLTDKIDPLSNQKTFDKILQEESVGGWWSLLLMVPGVVGLLVVYLRELLRKPDRETKEPQNRLLVALVNGGVWSIVLAALWYYAAVPLDVTKIQLFHHSLTFEFYVPLLGFLGSLLYVFDLFRSQEIDEFKEKEFGMRIIMGPYVAIVIVSLFGRDMQFVDFGSQTGQGTLALFSGLLVVVALQGLIERANETLGRWRRTSGYKPSPIAIKFKLSETEDMTLRKIAIRHPEQLREREESILREEAKKVGFDEHLAIAIKKKLEKEKEEKDIQNFKNESMSKIIWKRLRKNEIKELIDFAIMTNEALDKLAKEKPPINSKDLQTLRNQARILLNLE